MLSNPTEVGSHIPFRIVSEVRRELVSLDLQAALGRLGYAAFRPGQREAIETLLSARRLLLVAPTGGGKSLVYQLPATVLAGTSVVISPLIALMHDQVQALALRGVSATYFSSTLDGGEVRRRMARTAAGQYSIVYVAPERLVFPGFRGLLKDIDVPLVAVDEAHCISQWGHDFRPEYLQIGDLLAELGPARVLACTATATPVVRDEIVARLGLPSDTPQIVRGFARPNLILRAVEVASAAERSARVDALLAESLGGPGHGRGVAIVYAPTRRGAEAECGRLAARGWRAEAYHAGMEAEARERAQRAFASGDAEVVAATVAFGMGIDRPDVRAVVHLAPPGSIEAYYQEVGRAGRDGEPAWGLLLASPGDMPLRRRILESSEGMTAETLAHKWEMYLELMRWVEGGSCRHDAILRYFGDEAETLAGCGQCDVCRALGPAGGGQDGEEAALLVRQALSAVARVHDRFGLTAASGLLLGAADARLARAGLDRTPTFGLMRTRGERWVTRLLRRLVTAGYVDFTAGDRPVVLISETGRAVMRGEVAARVLLPAVEDRAPWIGQPGKSKRRRAKEIVSAGPAFVPGGSATRLPAAARGAPAALGDPIAEQLFEALRAYRLQVAREAGIPPYAVASDRSLHEMAELRPRTPAELREVYGIGPAKTEKYGADLLAIVERFAAPVGGAQERAPVGRG